MRDLDAQGRASALEALEPPIGGGGGGRTRELTYVPEGAEGDPAVAETEPGYEEPSDERDVATSSTSRRPSPRPTG